jgi:integrase
MPNYKGKRAGTRRIVIWWKGKPKEWVVRGTKWEADAFEARKRVELSLEMPVERRVAATFFELSKEYRVHAELHLKASTWKNARIYQVATLVEFFGDNRLPEVCSRVDAFKHKRVAEDGVQPSSVNNELRVLKTMLLWGREKGHAMPVPKWKPLPVRGAPRPRAFSRAELERLWAACRTEAPHVLPILIFLVNTGCRKGEALVAEWDWVDFDGEMLRIPSTRYWQPKSGKPREVPLSDALRALLTTHRLHDRWVFPSTLGDRFERFPKEMWGRIVGAAGLSGGPHQLRHTFASHFLQAVPDLGLLAEVMGHSRTRVTELYAHLLPGHLGRAKNAVNLSPDLQTVGPDRGTRLVSTGKQKKRP